MKFKYNIINLLCCAILILAGCEEETGRTVYPYSCPEMSDLKLSSENQIEAADSLFLSVNVKDPETPLSTLEITINAEEEIIYNESIRTKGYEARIENHGIYIPFEAGTENKDAKLTITAINVEGSQQSETRDIKIVRPYIPQTIYLHYEDKVIPMRQQEDNPYEYATETGDYPTILTGKISTEEHYSDSKLIWGYSESVNYAELTTETGAGFSLNYEDWQVEQITFNTLTFKVGVVGSYQILTINGVELVAGGGYYQASINFEQGEEVETTGFENIERAYNRDFFEYDPDNNTLTFLRETGNWEVYYSGKYNYMWIVRTVDVAPDAFWLVGHGFTAASVWNDDYNSGGWETEDISRMAYAVKVAPDKYQTTIYLNDTHEWGSFEIEIYSDREWNKDNGMELQEGSLQGESTGFAISESNGITNTDGFMAGYYRLTFDTSAGVGKETLYIERIDD